MEQATVGTKYQIVIPKNIRRKILEFKPGIKVSISVAGDNTLKVQVDSKSWVAATYGLMKNEWQDPIGELEKIRGEWDEKTENSH